MIRSLGPCSSILPRPQYGADLELSNLLARAGRTLEANDLRALAEREDAEAALRSPQADRVRVAITPSSKGWMVTNQR